MSERIVKICDVCGGESPRLHIDRVPLERGSAGVVPPLRLLVKSSTANYVDACLTCRRRLDAALGREFEAIRTENGGEG